jgi:hypothetical protein
MMNTQAARTMASDNLFCDPRRSMSDLEDDLTNDEAMAATHDQIERLLAERCGPERCQARR